MSAFRRLIGKPILQDVRMQDVVFAGGRGLSLDADAASGRACVDRLADLNKIEKALEKNDLRAVREGLVWDHKSRGLVVQVACTHG